MPEGFGVSVFSNDEADDPAADFGTWVADVSRLTIRYRYAVIDEIRVEATDKFLSIPRGGLEIGGVLFGTISGEQITILARRALALEYKTGPGFVLSGIDEENLLQLLAACASDPQIGGTEPVGWYHSHTRSGIFLSAEDVAVHDKFFPAPHQVALVVRPAKFQPTRAGFFIREEDGSIRTEASYHEFTLERVTERPSPQPVTALEPSAVVVVPQPRQLQPIQTPAHRAYNTPAVALAILLVIAAIALAFMLQREPAPSAAANGPAGVRLTGSGDHVLVEWNHSSKDVREASRGALDIFDAAAGRVSIPLDGDSLRKGSVTYSTRSQNVEVRLRLYGQQHSMTSESVAHYVKPLPPITVTHHDVPPEVRPPEPVRSPQPLPPITVTYHDVPQEPVRSPQPQPSQSVQPVRTAVLPASSRARTAAPLEMARILPGVDQAPQISASAPPQSAPPSALPRVAPPAPAPAKPQRQFASGRTIWTGQLRKGGVLMIDGGRASIGALNGRMPAGPVRITAHPAELIDGGMQVYTPNATGALSEPPSARNGWNLTVYQNDAKRVRDIGVVEAPSAKNGWRLVLRGDARNVGIIVFDWQEIASSN